MDARVTGPASPTPRPPSGCPFLTHKGGSWAWGTSEQAPASPRTAPVHNHFSPANRKPSL